MSPGCPSFPLEWQSAVVPFTKAGHTDMEWRSEGLGRVGPQGEIDVSLGYGESLTRRGSDSKWQIEAMGVNARQER